MVSLYFCNVFSENVHFYLFWTKKGARFHLLLLHVHYRAIDGARTRGLDLGKVARYQLRHYRISG